MSLQEDLDARGSNMADLRSTTQGLPIISQCQQTSYTGNSTSDMFCIPRTFEGQIFKIEDGTRWQVLQPLSQVKLQQMHSPCEGTQVFTCICVDGAWGSYGEMVVKIKFQLASQILSRAQQLTASRVRATQESIEEYKGLIADYEDALRRSSSTEENESLLARTRRDLSRCTQPSRRLNYDTKQERKALDRLGAQQCANAPWLLGFAQGQLCPGIHAEAITEGYCAFLLMTKLPATSLPHIHFCKMPLEKRDRIRAAFKETLM